MAERNSSQGYVSLCRESTPGTPSNSNPVYTPYYDQKLVTDQHLMSDEPVYGNPFKTFQLLPGTRSHGGSLTVMAEPNTAAHWFNMLTSLAAPTGSNPYTYVGAPSVTTAPATYTLNVSLVSQVVRFVGVQASKIGLAWDDQKMQFAIDVSALKSFMGREVATIATTTVTLTTDYESNPTSCLAVGDLVSIVKPDGSTRLDTTIASITNGTTVVLGASAAAFAAGDMLILRPATPALTLLTPFIWGKTEYRFGATASAALSATHTPMEPGTELEISYGFEDDEGSKRSGSFDPGSLNRTEYDYSFKAKKYFDTPADIKDWNAKNKRSCVMRAFAGNTNQYELRVTMNHLKISPLSIPTEKAAVIYEEMEFMPQYDTTDGQAFSVTIINALSTL